MDKMDNLVEPTALVVYDANVMNDCISAATDDFEDCNDRCADLSTISQSMATSGPYENETLTVFWGNMNQAYWRVSKK